jgi:hypothetical protein
LKPGISEMTAGKTTKASPTPSVATSSIASPAVVARNPRAAKTPMPASSSKEEFAKPAMNALPLRSASRGR